MMKCRCFTFLAIELNVRFTVACLLSGRLSEERMLRQKKAEMSSSARYSESCPLRYERYFCISVAF